jgi:DNA-binding response OmpR family regulator
MAGETILVIDDSPTILKLVQLVLAELGHRVETVSDGAAGLLAARDMRPALILLDDGLRDTDIARLCRQFREAASDPAAPIVLMTSRPESERQEIDDLLKDGVAADAISKPFSPDALKTVVSHLLRSGADTAGEGTQARLSLTPVVGTTPSPADRVDLHTAALAGDLGIVRVADVLSLLAAQQQSGVLDTSRDGSRVRVYFTHGRVDLATAAGVAEEFLLGRYLVEDGILQRSDLTAALAEERKREEPRLLGEALAARGLVTEAHIAQASRRQTSALVHEILRWNRGRFAFTAGRDHPDPVRSASHALAVDRLVVEGLRRIDEWRIIEREIHDFDEVFVREEDKLSALGPGKLLRDEIAVAHLVDGKNTVKDIVYLSKLGSFDVCRILYRLLISRLVRRRVPPVVL